MLPPIVIGNLIPAVTKVLNLLGDDTTFTRTVPGALDPSTGSPSAPTVTTFVCKGISDQFNWKELQNETIEDGDMKYIILPTDGNVPKIGDVATVTGIQYRVLNVLNENIQGHTYLFTLQLRI